MSFTRPLALSLAGAALLAPASVAASDEGFEFWLNPSVATSLDENTGLELETAQRFRSAADGRADTYFFRLWVNQDLADNVTLSGALEQRANDGGRDERRVIQQLSTSHGVLRTRLRLEQRFQENRGGRMGLRARGRVGLSVPLDGAGNWAAKGDAELFYTLRATGPGGDTGLTGLRTQLALENDVSENLTISAGYLRQQDFTPGAPDTVGHAPIIGIEFGF